MMDTKFNVIYSYYYERLKCKFIFELQSVQILLLFKILKIKFYYI
jgi:hypothetical protein